MPKKLKKKPLQKYQYGGETNPFAMFQGSGLDNPFSSGINYNLFGQLQTTPLNQQFQNFTSDNFGQQIGQAATNTAKDLGQIPGMQGTFSGMPEWGGEYAQKMKQDVAKEKGLTYNSWTGKWKNDKGEVFTNKELEDLAGMRYDEQKATKERNQKLAPLAAPLLMLNELGEAQKRSYAQAQKESMYDVSRGPSAMESRGFFAKQGGNVSRLQQMLGYNIPKAQNSLNTGYSWSSPSSQSAAKVAPPSKSNYATSKEKPTKEAFDQELEDAIKREEAKDQKRRLKNNAYQREFYDVKQESTSTQFPNEGERRAIERRDLVNQNIQFQKDYVQSPDVRKRLYNQIKEYYPGESDEKINSLVDERIQQYLYKLDNLGVNFNSSEEIREKGSLAYYQPLKNEVYLPVDKDKNTLKSFASHEIRHAYDLKPTLVDKAIGLNTTSMAISDILSTPRTASDAIANVQKNSKYKEQELQGVEVPYENQTDEKTARMMQLRVYADQKGLHKKGSNITRDTFDKVIKSIEEEGLGGSAALDALETLQKADKVDKDEIFRLWNETVDVGDKNSYNSQVENNQNPIISAKQGMRTPPVTEVYRMMGAHQGLPETSYKLASVLNFKTAKKYEQGAYVKMLDSLLYEDGGGVDGGIKEDSVRNLTEEETNAFNAAKQRLVDYVNSPQWEDRFVKMQIPAADMNKARTKDLYKTIKEDMSIAREAILSNLDKSTPLIVSGKKIQNQAGMFDPDKGYIYINQDFSGPGEIQNVLLHELGHSATDPNTEYVARFVEDVTKSGKEIDPQSMQKFFSSKGKPLTEMDIAYTMEKEIPVLVNTLRGKADEYGILRYGEDFTPAALNKLLEISNMSTGGTDPAADRDREFLKNQIQYLQSMLKGDENTLLQTLNTIAAADRGQQAPYYNAKNGARISQLLFNTPQQFQNSGESKERLRINWNPASYTKLDGEISNIARSNVDKQNIKNKKIINQNPDLEYTGDIAASLMGLNPIGGIINSSVMATEGRPLSEILFNVIPFYKLAKKVDMGKGIGKNFLKIAGISADIPGSGSSDSTPPTTLYDMPINGGILPEVIITAPREKTELILDRQQGGNVTNAVNSLEQIQKIQNNMYNNNQRVSKLAMLLGGGLIRGYQEGGMQQPMSPEEEQMMMQAMQEQQAMQQPQQQPMPQQGGEMEQEGEGGQNKYMQLPPEQQAEVYKQIIDFILENGIDALEQQFPEEYQFFEEFSDKLEGEDMEEEGEGEQEGGGEMETEAGRMQMGGGEMEEEEMQSEYPTDEEEVPVGARPGENSMRPAQPMPGAQQMKEGGIPERYRKLGYTKVGQKRQSDRPGKKWAVLAKKGDQYKIVHGGAKGMDDFKQHGNKDRQKRFWDRMGGKDSAKANDEFSPLFWHKRFGTW